MSTVFILYTTAGCHLCEQAKSVFWPCADVLGVTLREIDIAESEELVERYGIRIPVIASERGEEIGWPFDQQQLLEFLKGQLG
ncbi:glutaredoxin family protein [Pseudoteredinibacter isoporae]|uniref:Glutaredoxin n=1 Tax=Pseudoteredinibacter isoporae TaxID=570281 RepID=A0A7X0MVX0_9GAMM|nr:glutaredoxin family protein [Pseudoteredinibacter isoporae]MBB6521580.1 glutaredoxin [Pseudoteredinibacter isoporae]NHO87134.1 glutaredoxin family protein [Pseudoteredinibacter isoporae]NIB22958.1 glutaredoxin family protein [Pseudoteredinibacter isoporae]